MAVLTTEMTWKCRRSNKNEVFHTSYEGYYLYQLSSKNPVSKKVYVECVLQVVEGLMELLLDGSSVYVPNVGVFSIVSKSRLGTSKRMPVNWPETLKYWEAHPEIAKKEKKDPEDFIRHLNLHSGGYVYRVKWSKKGARLSNKHFYGFRPSKFFKKALRDRIRNGEEYPHD